MDTGFDIIQEIVKCLSGLDLRIVSDSEDTLLEALEEKLRCPTGFSRTNAELLQIFKTITPGCIYEVTTYLNVHYQILYLPEQHCYLVIGPCLTRPFSEQEMLSYLHRYQVNESVCKKLMTYCERLPVVQHIQLHQLGNLLAQHLLNTQIPLPYKRVDYNWNDVIQKELTPVDHYEEFAKIRRVELRYEFNTALTEAVKKGNLFLAYHFLQQIESQNDDLVRTQNRLRNTQNLCITINTQFRHALEECGIHPYRLDVVSGEIARNIEKLPSVQAAETFAADIIRQYCELSQENFYLNLKPFSRQVVTYIKAHLSDNLSVKAIAKVLMVNPDYLSTRFHQEVGLTVIDFINRERIDQAAVLLKRTNLQIQQIASSVGYNNTSYFAKQFAKYQKMTPGSFRRKGIL